jgi:hypothetical protein
MVLAFFDAKGFIYTIYVPRGTIVNAMYIIEDLGSFMKILKKKRPVLAVGEWFLHWDNALVTLPPLSLIGWRPGASR